ncbi:MAG: glycosyltransferase [Candidatus Pacebacteria bacterium]|nr:glycosyltransferase [Candidatus Paceibacterota bacterium]
MKILMITPYLPYPPSSGGQVRSYNLIKQLATRHEITLFSLIKDPGEKKYVKKLLHYCRKVGVFARSKKAWNLKNILQTGFGLFPFLVVRNFSSEAKWALVKELKNYHYDLIHAETFYVMPHLPMSAVPVLLVEQTIEYQVYAHFAKNLTGWARLLKPLLYLDVAKLRWWEKYYWQKAEGVIAVSEADKNKMMTLCPRLKVGVVPNGAGEDLMKLWGKTKPAKKPTFFFQANFSWLQNIEAARILAREVFPRIKKEIPEAECWIVGQSARDKIGSLSSADVKIVDLKTADIKGVVEAYKQATVFIAPLQGPGGTRLKILAAMAAGVPVITTRVGIEGIDARDGREIIIRDNWSEMARAAVLLIRQKKARFGLAYSARKLIERRYSYQSIARSLARVYREIADEKKS